MTTRFLLSVAAVAVAAGLAGVPNAYLFTALSVAAPWALGVAAGLYALPGVLAQAVFRRGGVGLVAQLLGGLAAAPFVPSGILSVTAYLIIGVLIELPFLVLRYRVWRPWLFVVSAVWAGAVYGLGWALSFDTPSMGPLVMIGQPALLIASMLVITVIALVLARLLERTGVLRGLRAPSPREPRKATP